MMKINKLLVFLTVFIGGIVQAQGWMPVEVSTMPEPVSNNAVTEGFVNGVPYIYSFAGIDSTKNHAGIHLRSYRMNTLTNVWEQIGDLPDTMGKIAASANRVGDVIYIIGGYNVFPNGSETSSAKVHRYQISTNSYLANGVDIPVPIDDQVQCVYNDSLIFVVTGWSNTGNVSNVQIYDPALDAWQTGTATTNNNNFKAFGAAGEIIGDTIYYFGGASNGINFPARSNLRKGYINPTDPSQIVWFNDAFDSAIKGYRTASTTRGDTIYWIGGSDISYNYNGIAYNGSGGVSPINRNLIYHPISDFWIENLDYNYPMDLRGIANTGINERYLTGGMLANQQVSDKTYKLTYVDLHLGSEELIQNSFKVYPTLVNDVINVSPIETNNYSIELIDLSGRVVLRKTNLNGFSRLNVSELNNQTYLVRISSNKYSVYHKIIVNR